VCGRHPQMIQLSFVMTNNQRVEAEHLAFAFSNIHLIGCDKVRRDCEVLLPVIDPMFRIAPMSFGIMSKARQRRGVFS